MVMSDPIADLLTRLRNGQLRGRSRVKAADSGMKRRILAVLKEEGFIQDFRQSREGDGPSTLEVDLKYHRGEPVIRKIARVSRPGRRVYRGAQDLPQVADGLGVTIVSTPAGVLSDAMARRKKVGGEVICQVF